MGPGPASRSRGRRSHQGRRGRAPVALASSEEAHGPARSFLGRRAGRRRCSPHATPSRPSAHQGAPFHERAETKEDSDFRVTVAALSGEEARRFLGVDLERKGVRAIWVEIENRSDQGAWYFPIGTDPAYFAPYEVAYLFQRWWAGDRNPRIAAHLIGNGMPLEVPPRGNGPRIRLHARRGGNRLRPGRGRRRRARSASSASSSRVPGERWDFQRVDFATLYPASQVRDLDFPSLLAELEKLPCCAADKKGNPVADPLNLVIVGKRTGGRLPLRAAGMEPHRALRRRSRPGEA